jgi:hypothetical protein
LKLPEILISILKIIVLSMHEVGIGKINQQVIAEDAGIKV